jgi:hypothetical protein
LYVFLLPYLLGIATVLDHTGRVATATLGYSMIPYALGTAVFGFLGLSTLTTYSWLSVVICSLAALAIYPLIQHVDRLESKDSELVSAG